MRNVSALNRWIGIAGLVLCLSLAVLAVPGWWYLRHHEVPDDAIVRTRELGPGLMLYVVRRAGCDMPVPHRYDYYLSGRAVDRGSLGALLDRRAPFLVADSDMADVVTDGDDTICVSLLGRVFGFSNRVALETGGTRRTVAIGIAARPPTRASLASAGAAPGAVLPVASTRPDGQRAIEGGEAAPSVCRMLP